MNRPEKSQTIPDHVPPHLVVDLDIYDVPEGELDPHIAWRKFQGKGPIVFSPYNGGCWIPTEGDDVVKFMRNAKLYSNRQIAIPDPGDDPILPIQADPPEHAKYRAIIQPFFSPSAVTRLDKQIRSITVELIDHVRQQEGVEFVKDFALQLPVTIFLDMAGLPRSDRWALREMVELFISSPEMKDKARAHDDIRKYMESWVEKRLIDPGDDMISKVAHAQVDGRPLSRLEILSTLTTLLHAGLDTLSNLMSFITYHLARNPHHREYIRNNPDRMDKIVQEFIRRFSGPNNGRVVVEDHSYRGVDFKKGDRIFLIPSFFNQDPDTTPDPDKIDFNREARNITFGAGPHVCAGALLARRQVSIFLSELLARIPEFEVDPAKPLRLRAAPQNSVEELWLKWV